MKRGWKRIRALLFKSSVERELAQEMELHLDLEIQKNLRVGMSPAEARRQAHISFGGVERYKQQTREARAFAWIGGASLDMKLGVRMLVKYPGLTLIGGLALAAAIGLGAAWFEVTQQFAKPRLPFAEGDRIVRIDLFDAAASRVEPRALYDFQLWREQLTAVNQLGAYRSFERNLITADGNGSRPRSRRSARLPSR